MFPISPFKVPSAASKEKFTVSTFFSISIFALILLIVILALIYNFLKQESISPEQILPKNAHIILYFNSFSCSSMEIFKYPRTSVKINILCIPHSSILNSQL